MGKGEYNGMAANLRALCVILSPLFYGKLYARGERKGCPELVFYGSAAFIAAAETTLRYTGALTLHR